MSEDLIFGVIQGILAVTVVGSACVIAVGSVLAGRQVPDVPAWLTLAIGAILGFFFGTRTFRSGVATATNGMLDAAHKIAVNTAATATNSQEMALLARARSEAAAAAAAPPPAPGEGNGGRTA